MKQLITILTFCFLSTFSFSQQLSKFEQNDAFDIGEALHYSVQYSLYLDVEVAGFILKVEEQTIKDKKMYGLTAYGETYNYSDNFMKVKAGYQSIVDTKFFLPRIYIRSLKRMDQDTKKTVILNHENSYAKTKGSEYKAKINQNTRDILSTLYLLRALNIETSATGSEFWINTLFSNKIWNLGFKKVKTESIKTKFGQVDCIVLQPIFTEELVKELNFFKLSEKDPIIKSADQIKIWLTNDKNKVPVKIESITNLGSMVIELKKFENLKNEGLE